MIKVSVIMPVYDAEDYLDMSINSFLSQSLENIELICVDDGSTDNSSNIIKTYMEINHSIKYFSQKNTGSAKARNKAINEASGEYIAFLDADDKYLDNEALKQMYNLASTTNSDMVAANLKRIRINGCLEEDYDYVNTLYSYFTEEKVINSEDYGIPWAFYKNIYKKEFLQKYNITFPDLKRGQDSVFLANVLSKVKNIHCIPLDFYGYNYSASGGVNVKVDDYDKKNDYIEHFIQTFTILRDNSFNKTLEYYKNEFINYLIFRDNIYDKSIHKILEQKEALNEFYNKEDYGYLIIDLIRNPPKDSDIEYEFIKDSLFEESLLENVFIDVNSLKKFIKLSSEHEDIESLKSSYKLLKSIDNYSFEEKRETSRNVEKLKSQIKHYIKTNNDILTSNSWKFTSFLRSLKHKI